MDNKSKVLRGSKMAEYKQLHYDIWTADLKCGVNEHPQKQMKNLGYKVIGSVPQSIADCWWFTVEEFIEPLPPYLKKMSYNFDYWHGGCWKTCEHFKKNGSCCYGGSSCKKNT